MADLGDSGAGGTDVDDLARRVRAIENRLAELPYEIKTKRLMVVDDYDHVRVAIELVDEVLEMRVELPSSAPGRRTGLLIFSIPEQPDLCAGFGIHLLVDGNIVNELAWWADEEI